jgi:hypothetical protein
LVFFVQYQRLLHRARTSIVAKVGVIKSTLLRDIEVSLVAGVSTEQSPAKHGADAGIQPASSAAFGPDTGNMGRSSG